MGIPRMDRSWSDRGRDRQAIMPAMIPAASSLPLLLHRGAFHWWVPRQHAHRNPLNGFSNPEHHPRFIGSLILLWIYRMATRGRSAPRVP